MSILGTKNAVLENAGLKMQDSKMQHLENPGPGIQYDDFHIYACVTDTSSIFGSLV